MFVADVTTGSTAYLLSAAWNIANMGWIQLFSIIALKLYFFHLFSIFGWGAIPTMQTAIIVYNVFFAI